MEGELQMVLNQFQILRDFNGRVRQEARGDGDHRGEIQRCYFVDMLQRGGSKTLFLNCVLTCCREDSSSKRLFIWKENG